MISSTEIPNAPTTPVVRAMKVSRRKHARIGLVCSLPLALGATGACDDFESMGGDLTRGNAGVGGRAGSWAAGGPAVAGSEAGGEAPGRAGAGTSTAGRVAAGGAAGEDAGASSGGEAPSGFGGAAGAGNAAAGGTLGGRSGAAGAGGERPRTAPRFVVLEPPADYQRITETDASADAAVIAGTVTRTYLDEDQNPVDERSPFVWTEATGVVRLAPVRALPGRAPHTAESLVLSSDGRTLTGTYSQRAEDYAGTVYGGFLRWTAGGGLVSIDVGANFRDGILRKVSADGSTFVGEVSEQPAVPDTVQVHQHFRWTESGGFTLLGGSPGWPEVANVQAISADGKVLLVNEIDDETWRALLWTESNGITPLGTLPGYESCESKLMTPDGAFVVGRCWSGTQPRLFRWTRAAGMVPLTATAHELYDLPSFLSPDASAAFGPMRLPGGYQTGVPLYRWTLASGFSRVPAPATVSPVAVLQPDGMSSDSSVLYGAFHPNDGETISTIGDAGTRPFRWSEESGIVPLPVLPGQDVGRVRAASADGDVLVGYTHKKLGNERYAAFWDTRGVHSLAAELTAAGIDLEGYRPTVAWRVVATADSMRVVGSGVTSSGEDGPFVAWLPRPAQ